MTPSQFLYVSQLHSFCTLALFSVLVLLLLKLLTRDSQKSKTKNGTDSKKTIPKLRHRFSTGIQLLDGIYTLYQLKTVGLRVLDKWCENFGTIFQISVGTVNIYGVGDASIAQKILSSSQPTHLNKANIIYDRVFVEWFQDGLINSDYKIWFPHRKMLSRCFMYKSLQHYLQIMNKHGKNLVNELSSVAMQTRDCENTGISNCCVLEGEQIHDMMYFHVIKIIAQIVMGTDDRFSEDTLKEWAYNYRSFKYLIIERFLNPLFIFSPFWHLSPLKKDYERSRKYVTEFFRNIIPIYRKEHEEEMKMNLKTGTVKTGELMNDNDVGEKEFRCVIQEMLCCNATDKQIYDEVGTLIGAGHDTLIIALQMLLVQLALNPEHQTKCRQEIDDFFAKKIGSAEHDDKMELNMGDLTSLRYLERCVSEILRLMPSVPVFIRRLDSPINIGDGMQLEKGSNVAISPWLIHRNTKYYSDPEKFDPDRFLSENVKNRHPYAYIPFSGGDRNCIGNKVAVVEIKVITMWILRNFEVESKDKLEDVRLNFEITLLPERNYNLVLRKRKNM